MTEKRLLLAARKLVAELVPAGATKRLPDNVTTRELLHDLEHAVAAQPEQQDYTCESCGKPLGGMLCSGCQAAGSEHQVEVGGAAAKAAVYSLEHGTSPEAEAARVLRRFMCCEAGRNLVEHALLQPFGYSLEPGRVVTENRLLADHLERAEVDVSSYAQELHDGTRTPEDVANRLAELSERMRRQLKAAATPTQLDQPEAGCEG